LEAATLSGDGREGATASRGDHGTPENKQSYEAHLVALPLQKTQHNMRNAQLRKSCYSILSEHAGAVKRNEQLNRDTFN
jgi:hypothetical protein